MVAASEGGVEDGERSLIAADEAFARRDADAVVAHLSAALRAFTAAGEPCREALVCARLGDVMANRLGNRTAARAWFVRARRLVADLPPCPEQGWVAVAAMGCDVDDPHELLESAEFALERARRFGDVNLETKALADAGLAHVQLGRLAEGMALLDESMALACGPADDGDAAAKSVCSFFTACYFAADYSRASSWADLLRRHGLISHDAPGPAFLSSHCDSVQATLLMELGRWGEAEQLLERASAAFESVLGMPSWHPEIALADLRIRQGRLADAEVLLVGKEQSIQALLPAARLYLASGDLELASAAATRGVQALTIDRLRAAELLTTLLHVEVLRGDLGAARATMDDLAARLDGITVVPLLVRATLAHADLLARTGDLAGAVVEAGRAVALVTGAELPWVEAQALIAAAGHRRASGDIVAAAADARAATMLLDGLDVVVDPAAIELLEELTMVGDERSRSTSETAMMIHDGRWWDVSVGTTTVRVPDTKGMRYLAELVVRPGVERHALDLVDRVEGISEHGIDRRRLGDAGPLLDGRARTAYRLEIERLRSEIDDALAVGLLETAEGLQADLDLLVVQLASAFGLGGRARRAGSAAEKARLNVTRAIRTAIRTLEDALPAAGATLDEGVHTGQYCVYRPAPGDRLRWIVHTWLNIRYSG
jgi:tetratricopeptide (TPR) repeat protein